MTRDEKIWSSIKFTLLLCFSVALLYILLCKYVTPIPESITGNAVTEINEAEAILEDQKEMSEKLITLKKDCLLYTSPSPRDYAASRMPSSA